jgi:hypothetical protein
MMIEGSNYCRNILGKPVFLSVSLDPFLEDDGERNNNLELKRAFERADYPVYPSSEVTVKALGALYKYAKRTGYSSI